MGRSRACIQGLAVCLALSACAGQPSQTAISDNGTTPVAQDQNAGGQTASLPPENPGSSAKAAARMNPESLVGMTGGKITALFGRPVFVRRDPPGEFWRYRTKSCVLELFLYRNSGDWQVDHIEMRRGNQPIADKPACLAALQENPRKR